MNHKQTLVILGSGLMVLTLATAAGFFLFAPASSTAQLSGINGASANNYDDFVPTPDPNTQTSNLEANINDNNALSAATLPALESTTGNNYRRRSISAASLATQRQRMAFRTAPSSSAESQNQNYPTTSPSRPTSAQDLQSIMDAKRLSQATLSANGPVPVPAEEFPLKQSHSGTLAPQRLAEAPQAETPSKPTPKPQPKSMPPQKTTSNYSAPKSPAKVAAKPAEKKKTNGYWIQLASYSTLNRAKGAQDDLRRLGLNTSIEVSNLGAGKLVYRVKAGAWSNEKEAKNFLETFTMSNKGFSDAFVVNSAL